MPVTVTHAKSNTIADWSGVVTVGDSTGGTTTNQASNLVRPIDWNSVHAVTLALAMSELPAVSLFEPFALPNTNSTLSAPVIGSWYLEPIMLPFALSSGRLNLPVSNAAGFLAGTTWSATSTGSWSRVYTFRNCLALWQQGTGASTSRLERLWTNEMSMLATWTGSQGGVASSQVRLTNALTLSYPYSWDISGNVSYSTRTTSGTRSTGVSTAASSFGDSLITLPVAFFSGARMDVVPFATTIPAGLYWLGHMFTTSTATSGTRYTVGVGFSTHSRLGMLENNMQAYKRLGTSVSNSTSTPLAFHGFFATTTSQAPANIATSDMRGTTGRLYWQHLRSDV